MKVSVHYHEMSRHSGIVTNEQDNIPITVFIRFWFENRIWILMYSRYKYIVYCLVRLNHLVHNWYFWNIIEEKRISVFNSMHYSKIWIINFQMISSMCRTMSSRELLVNTLVQGQYQGEPCVSQSQFTTSKYDVTLRIG